jgi:RHS repeat-associated protein
VTASRSPDNVLTVYYYDDFGALYAFEREGARYYVGSDHLGTPKVITDNLGNIIRQIEYDSWGVKISDSNPSFDLPVGFAGGIPDDATGLVRFGFRDYEPGTGRWAAKDPIFFKSGQANLFVYIGNDPVNLKDPSGLWTAQFGVTVNVQWGPISITGSAGIAFDGRGGVATYASGGGGLGVGARTSGGVSASVSTAQTVEDLAGPFNNFSVGAGLGPDVSADYFVGTSPNGPVIGGGLTVGVGLGAGGSTTVTGTGVCPLRRGR